MNNQFPKPPNKMQEKLDYTILSIPAIRALTRVLMYGAKKYDRFGWRDCTDIIAIDIYKESLLRHVMDYIDGLEKDKDSGLPTVAHIMANAMILLDLESNKKG